jgi:hypothetical protein
VERPEGLSLCIISPSLHLSTKLNGFLNNQQPYPAAALGKPSEVYSLSNKLSLAFAPFIHDLSTPLLLLLARFISIFYKILLGEKDRKLLKGGLSNALDIYFIEPIKSFY